MDLAVSSENDWAALFSGEALDQLTRLLPRFIAAQRWFGGKSRRILATTLFDWGAFDQGRACFALVGINYEEGARESYLLPLGMSFGNEAVEIQRLFPAAIVCPVSSPGSQGFLRDGLFSARTLSALLALISDASSMPMHHGTVRGLPSSILSSLRGEDTHLAARRSSAEQSNSSIFFGDKLIMKLFRKQQPGVNPDTEIGRYLTEHTNFLNIAPFGGSIEYTAAESGESDTYTFAMLQGLVANEGDGWEWTLGELERYYAAALDREFPMSQASELPEELVPLSAFTLADTVRAAVGESLHAAATLGRRTGELHLALGQPTSEEAFNPRPFGEADAAKLHEQLSANATRAFELLENNLSRLPTDTVDGAKLLLTRRAALLERFGALTSMDIGGLQTRVHGDYHLGQVLRTHSDFVILDFEGEPARPLEERRAKQPPLKDVAGMLRSFSYAAVAALNRFAETRPLEAGKLEPWAHLWERAVTGEFLKAYRHAIAQSSIVPPQAAGFQVLLEAYVVDKAFYELVYELNNRPAWVRIPLRGILALA